MQKSKIWIFLTVIAVILAIILGFNLFNQKTAYATTKENDYNMAFYQVTEYVQNVKTYLAKAMISKSAEHGAEMLTHVWREANMAQAYLGMLPIESQELENTEKFLNQVSEYSYALSRKNIEGTGLTDEDIEKIKELHNYSVDLSNTLNEMAEELNNGTLKWSDLTSEATSSQISKVSTFDVVEENFHEYTGLIYDGAFSEHITSKEKKGLTGDDITEETAKLKVEEFIGKEKIKEINSLGFAENANIPSYNFSLKTEECDNINVSISKKGGHIIYMNGNREVNSEIISYEDAVKNGSKYLDEKGFKNMKETYYLKQEGMLTINYAYEQDGVIMYPDLIKVKVALDDGRILGIETTGYLNNHTVRDISKIKISKDEAKKTLNKELNIMSEGLAVIPTEWESEVLCYEFKGKIENQEFLVYINAENGKEEDILIITNTPNGTLTM